MERTLGGRVIVVGTSTGGPPALEALLSPLPATFPVADRDRSAHACKFHRAAGPPPRPALRHRSDRGRRAPALEPGCA